MLARRLTLLVIVVFYSVCLLANPAVSKQAIELVPQLGHSGSVYAVAWSPDGKHVVSGSRDHTLKVWNVAQGTELRTLSGHNHWVRAVARSPDGRQVVSGSVNLMILWNVASGTEQVRVTFLAGNRWLVYHPHKRVYASSPDGDTLVRVRFDNALTPLYPLTYYRETLKRTTNLYAAFAAPQPQITPKRLRLW